MQRSLASLRHKSVHFTCTQVARVCKHHHSTMSLNHLWTYAHSPSSTNHPSQKATSSWPTGKKIEITSSPHLNNTRREPAFSRCRRSNCKSSSSNSRLSFRLLFGSNQELQVWSRELLGCLPYMFHSTCTPTESAQPHLEQPTLASVCRLAVHLVFLHGLTNRMLWSRQTNLHLAKHAWRKVFRCSFKSLSSSANKAYAACNYLCWKSLQSNEYNVVRVKAIAHRTTITSIRWLLTVYGTCHWRWQEQLSKCGKTCTTQ